MSLKEGDFVEIEFTGRVKDGNVFDSNVKAELEKSNPNSNSKIVASQAKPFVFALGKNMFLKGVDDFLIGKPETGEYKIELPPEKAFGQRQKQLVQIIPQRIFNQHKINPFPGQVLNLDSRIAKVLSVSGGRVMIDFNNPLAGKTVVYNIKVLKKVKDMNEKVKSLMDFLFRKEFKFEINGKILVLHVDKLFADFVKSFGNRFREILGLELEVREIEKEEKEKEEKIETSNKSQ